MQIVIDEEQIRQMVQEESEKVIRKRIKEMQGNYTSKGYLEEIISNILWETLCEKIPDFEWYVKNKIDELIQRRERLMDVPTKDEIIECVLEGLAD